MEEPTPKRSWWDSFRPITQVETVEEHLIHTHLDRLQRDIRMNRVFSLILLLAVLSLTALWVHQSTARAVDEIIARKIVIESETGRDVVILDSDRVGGRIALRFNEGGTPPPPALFLTATPKGGALQIYQAGHNFYAIGMDVAGSGEGVVTVRAQGMQPGVELRGPSEERPGGHMLIFNADGKPGLTLGTDSQGKGTISTAVDR